MTIWRIELALITALSTTLLVACGGGGETSQVASVGAGSVATVDASGLTASQAGDSSSSLSAAEAESLAYMRQEEQLAHDVYAGSATLWQQPIFSNISSSEATHAAAVQTLLDRYQQPDPLAGLSSGTFRDAALQTLYDELTARSRSSLVEALKVGVEIEEHDIYDITAQKANIDNADILTVYDSLLLGSRNHLRAFVKVLTQQGETYVPKYIGQAEFDAIVNSPAETGR